MNIRKILMAAILTAGFGMGMNAHANWSMHACCSAIQFDCDWTAPNPETTCAGVYNACMLGLPHPWLDSQNHGIGCTPN